MKIKIIMDVETPDFGGKELLKEFQNIVADIDRSGASKIETFRIVTKLAGHADKNFEWRAGKAGAK